MTELAYFIVLVNPSDWDRAEGNRYREEIGVETLVAAILPVVFLTSIRRSTIMWQLDVHAWSWKYASSTKCGFPLKVLLHVVPSNFNFVLGVFGAFVQSVPIPLKNAVKPPDYSRITNTRHTPAKSHLARRNQHCSTTDCSMNGHSS